MQLYVQLKHRNWLKVKLNFWTHPLKVVGHFKVVLAMRQFSLDLRVGVNYNCQKHVHQNEEHEEDKENKVDRTKNSICLLKVVKVEISEQNTKLTKSTNNKQREKKFN